jgi:ribosomal protein S1
MCKLAIGLIMAAVLLGTIARQVAYAEEVKCEGTITKIDGDMVTVKAAQEQQMKIEPATMISINGKPGTSMDLKVGQKVKCVCEKSGKSMTCTTLIIAGDTP